MAIHNDIGKKGEEQAVQFLLSKGYIIRDTNWRFGSNEIDIIAQKDKILAFIEVKTRTSLFVSQAHLTITKAKQKGLIKAANAYLKFKNINLEARFDILTIVQNNNTCQIEHIEEAFYPTI